MSKLERLVQGSKLLSAGRTRGTESDLNLRCLCPVLLALGK